MIHNERHSLRKKFEADIQLAAVENDVLESESMISLERLKELES